MRFSTLLLLTNPSTLSQNIDAFLFIQYGKLSDIFGLKKMITVAYSLFGIGCLLWSVCSYQTDLLGPHPASHSLEAASRAHVYLQR